MSFSPRLATAPATPITVTEHDALPAGTRFGEFEIVRVIGVGGFGIVYLARDHSLERDVALKEYMPGALAARGQGPQITIRSASFADTYAMGLRSFINEARLLARFDHPSLVKVYRFWEDNATAYMVMPYLSGRTLRETRRGMGHAPHEAWIRSVVAPILSALELLHREGVYHRDIAPDNILLPANGPPVLLDFGAARRVISDRTQSLTAILKPSYAPIEQYAEMTQLRQGPWTDFYALGAVIHYLLFGVPPVPATARAVQDDAEPIESKSVAGVSSRFLATVAWMLAVRPAERPQSGAELRSVLDGDAEIPSHGGRGVTLPPRPLPAGAARMSVAAADTTYAPTMHVARPAAASSPPQPRIGTPARAAKLPAARESAPIARPRVRASNETPASNAGVGKRASSTLVALGAGGIAIVAVAVAVALWHSTTRVAAPAPSPLNGAPRVAAPVAATPAATVAPIGRAGAAGSVASGDAVEAATPASASAARSQAPGRPGPGKIAESAAPRSAATAAARSAEVKPGERASPPALAQPARPTSQSTTVREPIIGRPVSPAAVELEPRTAREACGKRDFIALAVCMDEKCDEARFRNSPECTGILARKAARENRP